MILECRSSLKCDLSRRWCTLLAAVCFSGPEERHSFWLDPVSAGQAKAQRTTSLSVPLGGSFKFPASTSFTDAELMESSIDLEHSARWSVAHIHTVLFLLLLLLKHHTEHLFSNFVLLATYSDLFTSGHLKTLSATAAQLCEYVRPLYTLSLVVMATFSRLHRGKSCCNE